ncbi:hypothetical protein EV424DRAFT_642713 [Suillus variegatus]|nr:hypothetical protein EV424DRAFT_642713 [Suillus variegatus]
MLMLRTVLGTHGQAFLTLYFIMFAAARLFLTLAEYHRQSGRRHVSLASSLGLRSRFAVFRGCGRRCIPARTNLCLLAMNQTKVITMTMAMMMVHPLHRTLLPVQPPPVRLLLVRPPPVRLPPVRSPHLHLSRARARVPQLLPQAR